MSHFDALKKMMILKLCCSVNQIDDLKSSNKSSHGPSVFRAIKPFSNFFSTFISGATSIPDTTVEKMKNTSSPESINFTHFAMRYPVPILW